MFCLFPGHFVRSCQEESFCRVRGCTSKHSTFLHPNTNKNSSKNSNENTTCSNQASNFEPKPNSSANPAASNGYAKLSFSSSATVTGLVLLPVCVKAEDGKDVIRTYVFLDSGSNTSYCTETLLPHEIRKRENGGPYATKTVLGWILNGPLGRDTPKSPTVNFSIQVSMTVEEQFQDFSHQELNDSNLNSKASMSLNDRRALDTMEETVQLKDSHYEIAIPWKTYPPNLVNCNRSVAECRLSLLNNNNELNLHDHTSTYSIAKAMFRNQNHNTGQLRYFDNDLSRTSKKS